MASELGQISFYLAKEGNDFDSIIKEDNLRPESDNFKIREFEVDGIPAKFFCEQTTTNKPENPHWLDFINEKIVDGEDKVHFETYSKRPSGLLLININSRIFAASFGVRGGVLLEKGRLLPDFGIKTAMNMCGNKELRQTKSSTHSLTTQNIDRQLSKPSDTFSFGLSETEFLQYISAHLESDKKVTLQGKDNLTIKVVGDNKLSWEKLIDYGKTFVEEYESEKYKDIFPNYPNLQSVTKEKAEELDLALVQRILDENYECIHLAIPEFIADDKFSFSYSNYAKRQNNIFSHLDILQLKAENVLDFGNLDVDRLKNKHVYAYSHEEDKVLGYRKWRLYTCIVAEIELNEEYFVLSGGVWRKVDDEFYTSVTEFVDNVLQERPVSDDYHDIDISVPSKKQNREEVFNEKYCDLNGNAFLFDQAKLRIGQGPKDKEFCDILEWVDGKPADIIHVKKHGGSSSLNYLFSQARFYCEFFLSDEVFLSEIRGHIDNSEHPKKSDFLNHVKEQQADVTGKDYAVRLWVLYDKSKGAPSKANLPLMAKYELKMTYERLRNIHKYSEISLSMIPVKVVNFKTAKGQDEN
ncbi:MAG: TIGR04141 family sporadically distributed protein [Gammaproteobacteria bacterium]|nr:TIGR04141 family sporadically distributed protein [Gammaproteobacteria bacterium]